jgi:hypothetical protein
MRSNRDYVWAIFLIFLGSILLLNTTGILEWNIWRYILNYWPVFLIFAGLRLILGRSIISSIILSVLAIVTFSWVGVCSYNNQVDNPPTFVKNFSKYCTDVNIKKLDEINNNFTVDMEDYEDAEELEYDINLGVSKFVITDGSKEYLTLNAKYNDKYGEPSIEPNLRDENLTIKVSEQRADPFSFFNFKAPEYNFVLGSELLTTIDIDNGVGRGTIDFENQLIKTLNVETGTGDVDIKLGFNSIPTEEIQLTVGTGDITLSLPPDVGYLLNYNLGVGTIRLGDKEVGGFDEEAKELKSENYDDAFKIVNITADVGVGLLTINFNN